MLIISLLLNLTITAATEVDCSQHVANIYERRLVKLAEEGVIKKDEFGAWQTTLTKEELFSNRRFRNFPAISFEQIKWCPKLNAVESSLSFLEKVGFQPKNIDSYFKKLLFMSKNKDLVVLKDQVGLENGRRSLKTWIEQNPEQKSLRSHYAMAIFKDPKDQKIKARAGSNYIGNRGGHAVFTLPYHALFVDEQKKSCADFEFYFPNAPQHPLKAQKTIAEQGSLDVVFCEIALTENHKDLSPASLDASEVTHLTPLLTFGVGTLETSKKLELTIDASPECKSLVHPGQCQLYDSGVIDTVTKRWAMGCDVSAGNSGDGVYNRANGRLIGFVTTRSGYVYQSLASQVFSNGLSLERLYMETSHFVPLHEILKQSQLPVE